MDKATRDLVNEAYSAEHIKGLSDEQLGELSLQLQALREGATDVLKRIEEEGCSRPSTFQRVYDEYDCSGLPRLTYLKYYSRVEEYRKAPSMHLEGYEYRVEGDPNLYRMVYGSSWCMSISNVEIFAPGEKERTFELNMNEDNFPPWIDGEPMGMGFKHPYWEDAPAWYKYAMAFRMENY